MGSLAHYMQELSAQGFALADFINEGNGTIWDIALGNGPAPLAGWMLVEEHAEGGDVLAAADPQRRLVCTRYDASLRRWRGCALPAR